VLFNTAEICGDHFDPLERALLGLAERLGVDAVGLREGQSRPDDELGCF